MVPENCIKLITYIFNATVKLEYFPDSWKVSQIIMIVNPGKETCQVTRN